ncbi:MAG TPA: ribonuclease HII [Gemmatimonadales bacterium]
MIEPTLERERALWARGRRVVAGLDEVGRGPLAGPVVAAAVVFPPGVTEIEGLRDSKVMTPLQRTRAAGAIREAAQAWALGAASVREIDQLNIRRATALAMRRALERLPRRPDHVLVDGLPIPELGCAHDAIIDGDALCLSIAGASVLAKCARDALMRKLSVRYPAFGWALNKGYGTPEHLAAIDSEGPTVHHRVTFSPIAQPRLL